MEEKEEKIVKKHKGRKKIIQHTIVKDKKAEVMKDTTGQEHLVVVEQKVFYTVKNHRPGMMFFVREDNRHDFFEGHEVKEDITEKELKKLMKSEDYKNGWITVESAEEPFEELRSINSINDNELEDLIEKNKDNIDKLKKIIDNMTSDFSVGRLKDKFISHDLPSSLIVFCDYKLQQLEEEKSKSMKAPIFTEEKEIKE